MYTDHSFNLLHSYGEEAFQTSPFSVHQDDAASLQACEAFQLVQNSLVKQHDSIFCTYHRSSASNDEEAWLLQRDITHALILPVLWIHRYASRLANSLLGNHNIVDLELVFRGEARGAFAWLQCFIVEEEDWCMARGCPACVVSHVLEAEPTIRIVLVAGRLSQSSHQPCDDGPSPVLDFWLSSLHKALEEDLFWGPGFWEDIEARASWLEHGIQELLRQCAELESLAPGRRLDPSTSISSRALSYEGFAVSTKAPPPRIASVMKPISSERNDWMKKIMLSFWNSILADAAKVEGKALLSTAYLQPIRA